MPVSNPSFSGTTSPTNSVPVSSALSTLVVKGGSFPPLNSFGVTTWVPSSISSTGNIIYKEIKAYPEYAGQLLFTSTIGSLNSVNVTPNSAGLYVAVPIALLPENEAAFAINNYVWKPVLLDVAAFYIDPSTGRTWDPVGAFTCNPPYLCVE